MKHQDYKNHVRFDPLWHFLAAPLTLTGLGFSIYHLVNCSPENCFEYAMIVLVFVILFLLTALVRGYALRVQDRAIRAEEGLRYFILSGKRLDSRLRLAQIVALRFAADDELVALAQRAVDEQLSPAQIKQAIQHWRGDLRRV